MTQRDKIELRILSYPIKTDITFDEVKNYLQSKGFVMHPGKGDHMVFTHKNLEQHLSIPCNVKCVRPPYIKQIHKSIKLIDKED